MGHHHGIPSSAFFKHRNLNLSVPIALLHPSLSPSFQKPKCISKTETNPITNPIPRFFVPHTMSDASKRAVHFTTASLQNSDSETASISVRPSHPPTKTHIMNPANQKRPRIEEYPPQPNDDSFIQVRFDPHVKSARRRKSSIYDGNVGGLQKAGSAFLHKILGSWESVNEVVDHEQEDEEDRGYLEKMTRNQLHEMVLGLREMGRKYSNVQIHMKVKDVFILTKRWDHSLVVQTRQLAKWLLENGYNVYVEGSFEEKPQFDAAALMKELNVTTGEPGKLGYWTPEMCTVKAGGFDFVVTLGGDGTVLYASWLFQKVVPPVLSFALGSLGFLTKFDFANHAETLSRMFGDDGVTVGTIMRSIPCGNSKDRDLRQELLQPERRNTHRPSHRGTKVVLNEIVVDRGPNPTMATTELYANDEFLTSAAADGICVATPTGSTAYSLAAGGGLCHPALPGMLVTVICAHSLTFRPIILPDSMVLRIGVPYDARTTSWVSFDGRDRAELNQGDYVTIVTSQYPLPAVQYRMDNKDWFDSIKRTMNWGDRIAQKGVGA
ncbi:ATP-NAD kinase [Wilcoxina mikolae CBS 423.85]|nr:ATP-NAD kinase [Wilcoxina mikolae CBS 423.85]